MEKNTNHLVICIARQYGSGGRDIGLALSKKMGIRFYDKELLKAAADKSGIIEELFEKNDEKPTSGFSQMPSMPGLGTKALNYTDYVSYMPNEKMQNVVWEVIRDAAAAEPCIIIGRCADYILRGREKTFSVYLHANLDWRIPRISRIFNIEEDAARSIIRKTDRSRANYYSYYTDLEWGMANNYHMALDVGRLGIDKSVQLIENAAHLFCPE